MTIANFFLILTLPKEIQAETKIEFKPQIPIEGFTGGEIKETFIGEYIIAIYKYAIGVVGILAAVVMMFGGVRWIMAGGNASAISEAKAWIAAALTGLLLTLGSWMILNTVNPDLVNMKPIKPQIIKDTKDDYENCYWQNRVDLTKKVIKDESYCQGTQDEHPGFFCACDKKKKIIESEGTHKGCCYLVDLSGNKTYQCGNVPGTGNDNCPATCTAANSPFECLP